MTDPITAFVCQSPGMVNGDITVVEINSAHGQHYFKATQQSGPKNFASRSGRYD